MRSLGIILCGIFALESSGIAENIQNKELFNAGKKIYKTTCISCHGENGETNTEMRLVVKPRQLSKTILSEEQAFKVIKHGAHYWGAHSDIMPAFKYVYDDKEIRSVAFYISKAFNFKREQKVQSLLKQEDLLKSSTSQEIEKVGKKIFTKKCAKCHGKTGNGESKYIELSKNDDEFIYPYNLRRTLLSEDQIFLYAKYGGQFWGTHKDDMPSWKKKYSDFKLRAVAKYVTRHIVEINK
jgi:mono/diheme cytochrome c family protein